MNKIFITLFSILLLSLQIEAQVRTNFNNTERLSKRGQFDKSYSESPYEITPPNLTNALRRDRMEDSLGSKIFYIAEPVPVNINVLKLANWVSDEKYSYGKFRLLAKGAKTLSINFSNFFLPKGIEMFIYNKEAEMITGTITETENNENKIWGSSIYKGDELNIEIKLPITEKERLNLFITNVAYGYKDIFINKIAGFGQSGACNINVLCPLGNGWEPERNSVVFIARSNGSALCSGSMLMNTCATNIPYVLTADHCFQGDGNVAGWRVHFQAWSATCTPSQNSDGILFNGSTLRANWAASDFCLVQLNQTPAANSGIHYAGWSRQTNAATNGVGIHHPSGDVMKISNYITPLVREDDPVRCNVNAVGLLHWVVQWNQGVTEGGSSGSPLFDQNHRVVGQLSGGPSSCTQPANCRLDMYGRFDNSWTGGGTNATRLSNWLDPSNSGAIATNTTNISNLNPANHSLPIIGADNFCGSTSNYSLNVPVGVNVSWQSSNPNIATITPTGNPATLTRIFDGVVTITATTACGTTSTKEIVIGAPQIEMVYFSNAVGGEGYWCSSHINNLFSVEPANLNGATFEARLLNYPSMTVFRTNSWANTGTDPFGYVPSGWYIIQLRTTNSCGTSQWFETEVEYVDCNNYEGGGENFRITASPNPTDGDLNVIIDKEKAEVKALGKQEKVLYQLYNFNWTSLVKQWTFDNSQNRQNLNVRGLRSGQYILVVTKGKYKQSTQIIIK